MFPNIEWEEEGRQHKRSISTNPPSREDVNTLQKMLDEKLVVRQARYLLFLTKRFRYLPYSWVTPQTMLWLNHKTSYDRLPWTRNSSHACKRRTVHDYQCILNALWIVVDFLHEKAITGIARCSLTSDNNHGFVVKKSELLRKGRRIKEKEVGSWETDKG